VKTRVRLAAVLLSCLVLDGSAFAGRPGAADLAPALTRRIDAAIDDAWRAEAVTPAPPATDLELYRRMSLDLLGTIPSLEEIRAFEAEPEAGRRERLVSRLMADPRFHEAFAERLARIVVGAGKKQDDLFYRRRRFVQWLEDQTARHRPWDDIVRELVGAEGISVDGPANFVIAGNADPAVLAARTARAFLGVRLDCAQCHDHPFTSWKQADFEGLAAFFGRIHRQGPVVSEKTDAEYTLEDRKSGKSRVIAPRVPFDAEALPGVEKKRRVALGRWLTDPRNRYFARSVANRLFGWLLGKGLIEPVDEVDSGKPRFPAVLALLEEDLRQNGFDLERPIRAIVSTRAYGLASRLPADRTDDQAKLEDAFALYPLKALHPDQLANALWQATSFVTQDENRPLIVRFMRADATKKFVERHGGDLDSENPEDETLLQRLLLLNGGLLQERLKPDDPFRLPKRLVLLSPSDEKTVETAYLVALGRRPTPAESEHFVRRLASDPEAEAGKDKKDAKARTVEDLIWALLNSAEFSWNH
jgi:hypothetical protein